MELPKEPSECAFSRDPNTVCSSREYIEKMHEFLRALGKSLKTKDPEAVVEAVKAETGCDSELCIFTKSPFVKVIGPEEAIAARKELFKVAGPASLNDWLSNFHIDGTLEQFKEAFKGFVHIPYQMRDFQKQQTELATFDFAAAAKSGMKKFACVLNTDVSRGQGEHWYCLFGDFEQTPIRLEYFNSIGDYPQAEIHDWLTKLQYSLQKQLGTPVEILQVINRSIQKNNDDCGVYCLYYIWSRLNGIEPKVFSDPATAPNDLLMKEVRRHFFVSE